MNNNKVLEECKDLKDLTELNNSTRKEIMRDIETILIQQDTTGLACILKGIKECSKLREFKGKEIAHDIGELLQMKNGDYGSAVLDDYNKFGIISILTSLNHKMNRLISITNKGDHDVTNESLVDTLKDLAGYAICGLDAIGYMHDKDVI